MNTYLPVHVLTACLLLSFSVFLSLYLSSIVLTSSTDFLLSVSPRPPFDCYLMLQKIKGTRVGPRPNDVRRTEGVGTYDK